MSTRIPCSHTAWTYTSRYQKVCDGCHIKRYVEVAEWEEMLLFRRWQWKPIPTRPIWEKREQKEQKEREEQEEVKK